MRAARVTGKAGDVAQPIRHHRPPATWRRLTHFGQPGLRACQRSAHMIITSLTEPTSRRLSWGATRRHGAAAIATGSGRNQPRPGHASGTARQPASSRVKTAKCRSAPVASAKSPAMITPSSGTTECSDGWSPDRWRSGTCPPARDQRSAPTRSCALSVRNHSASSSGDNDAALRP